MSGREIVELDGLRFAARRSSVVMGALQGGEDDLAQDAQESVHGEEFYLSGEPEPHRCGPRELVAIAERVLAEAAESGGVCRVGQGADGLCSPRQGLQRMETCRPEPLEDDYPWYTERWSEARRHLGTFAPLASGKTPSSKRKRHAGRLPYWPAALLGPEKFFTSQRDVETLMQGGAEAVRVLDELWAIVLCNATRKGVPWAQGRRVLCRRPVRSWAGNTQRPRYPAVGSMPKLQVGRVPWLLPAGVNRLRVILQPASLALEDRRKYAEDGADMRRVEFASGGELSVEGCDLFLHSFGTPMEVAEPEWAQLPWLADEVGRAGGIAVVPFGDFRSEVRGGRAQEAAARIRRKRLPTVTASTSQHLSSVVVTDEGRVQFRRLSAPQVGRLMGDGTGQGRFERVYAGIPEQLSEQQVIALWGQSVSVSEGVAVCWWVRDRVKTRHPALYGDTGSGMGSLAACMERTGTLRYVVACEVNDKALRAHQLAWHDLVETILPYNVLDARARTGIVEAMGYEHLDVYHPLFRCCPFSQADRRPWRADGTEEEQRRRDEGLLAMQEFDVAMDLLNEGGPQPRSVIVENVANIRSVGQGEAWRWLRRCLGRHRKDYVFYFQFMNADDVVAEVDRDRVWIVGIHRDHHRYRRREQLEAVELVGDGSV